MCLKAGLISSLYSMQPLPNFIIWSVMLSIVGSYSRNGVPNGYYFETKVIYDTTVRSIRPLPGHEGGKHEDQGGKGGQKDQGWPYIEFPPVSKPEHPLDKISLRSGSPHDFEKGPIY